MPLHEEERRLRREEKEWRKTLHSVLSKTELSGSGLAYVMETPLVLELLGVEHLPVYMLESKIKEIHTEDHIAMSEEIFGKLPQELSDPMIVFKSRSVQGRLVVCLALTDEDGVNVVVPFELETVKQRQKVNLIVSAYGRVRKNTKETDYNWFWQNINEGNTVYVNKIKADAFYQSAGLQLPMEGKRFTNLFGSSIKTEEDLVKLKMEREAESAALKAVCAETVAEDKKSLSPAERSFLAEKEALLAQRKKWNPAYTVRTAKKLAEQGFGEKGIAAALQKHAPDIQNLPSAALRQNAAARIAKSAAGSVRVGQQEQNKEKSR
jgi:hypothetical protein